MTALKNWLLWYFVILPWCKALLWMMRLRLYRVSWTNRRLRKRVERLETELVRLRERAKAVYRSPSEGPRE